MGVGVRATDLERGEDGIASRVLLASEALYAISFFLPALDKPQRGTFRGYAAFLMAVSVGSAVRDLRRMTHLYGLVGRFTRG
jgi:hypothetical protein